jgi:hypothetical protein
LLDLPRYTNNLAGTKDRAAHQAEA